MLDGRSNAGLTLNTFGDRRRHGTADIRILGIIFKIPTTQRISLNIHAGGQPPGDVKLQEFLCHSFPYLFQQYPVKALRQQHAHGKGRAILIVRNRTTVLFRLCEESMLNGGKKARVKDFSRFGFHFITSGQSQTGRAVSHHSGRQPQTIPKSAARLSGGARYPDTRSAESALPAADLTHEQGDQISGRYRFN